MICLLIQGKAPTKKEIILIYIEREQEILPEMTLARSLIEVIADLDNKILLIKLCSTSIIDKIEVVWFRLFFLKFNRLQNIACQK